MVYATLRPSGPHRAAVMRHDSKSDECAANCVCNTPSTSRDGAVRKPKPSWKTRARSRWLANKLRLRAPPPVPLAHAKTLGPVRETAHTPPSSFTRIRLGLSLIVRHADITHHTVHSAQRRPAPLRAGVFSRSALLPAGLVAPLRLPPSPHTCMRCIGRPAQPVS